MTEFEHRPRGGVGENGAANAQRRKPSGAQKDAIVTVRMTEEKKESANRVLEKLGLKTSAAINMFYDYLVEHGTLPFEATSMPQLSEQQWLDAARFIDSIPAVVNKEGVAK